MRAGRRQIVAFHPVAAVLCHYAERRYPHDGEWTVVVRRATRGGIGDLVAALDRPDEPRPKNIACAAVYIPQPPVALVDAAGHHVFPRFPLDQCAQPQIRARNVLEHLPWKQLSVRRDRQQFTEAELTSHCSPAYKNMIYLDTKFRIGTSAGGPVLTRKPNDRLHACFYRAPATDLEVGRFARGEAFDVAQSRRLRAALTGPGQHRSCPPQREFALIATSRDHNVTVELGGCWRVLRDDGFGTADPSVVRRVLAPN